MYIVYAWPFFGLDQARGGFALERHESWNFWVFLWCLKSGNWVRVALLPAAACRKYPTTIATSRGIITWCCCCCCCCYFSVAVIGTILLFRFRVVGSASKTVTHGVCVICAISFQNAAAVAAAQKVKLLPLSTSTSTSIIQRQQHWETPPHHAPVPSTSPSRPSASAGQLARNWPTLGQHGSINGVNSKRDWRRSSSSSSRDGDRGSNSSSSCDSGNWQTNMLNFYAKMRLEHVGGGATKIQVQQSM